MNFSVINLAVIDLIFIGVVVLLTIRGSLRGFISELLSMAALVIGLLIAIFFFRRAAPVVSDRFELNKEMLPEIISFTILFIIAFLIIKLLETMLKGILGKLKLSGVDRVLGFFFGFAEGIVIVCLFIFLINIQPFFNPDKILAKSFFAEKLMQIIGTHQKEIEDMVVLLGKTLPGIAAGV